MKQISTNKILVYSGLSILAVTIGWLVYTVRMANYHPSYEIISSDRVEQDKLPQIASVRPEHNPPDFPAGFHLPAETKWISANKYAFPDGRIGTSRIYRTATPPAELYSDYQEFLNADRNWMLDEARILVGGQYFLLAHTRDEAARPKTLIITIAGQIVTLDFILPPN